MGVVTGRGANFFFLVGDARPENNRDMGGVPRDGVSPLVSFVLDQWSDFENGLSGSLAPPFIVVLLHLALWTLLLLF